MVCIFFKCFWTSALHLLTNGEQRKRMQRKAFAFFSSILSRTRVQLLRAPGEMDVNTLFVFSFHWNQTKLLYHHQGKETYRITLTNPCSNLEKSMYQFWQIYSIASYQEPDCNCYVAPGEMDVNTLFVFSLYFPLKPN